MQSSSIWLMDGTQTGVTTPGQSGPGINEGVLHTPQNWILTIKYSLL